MSSYVELPSDKLHSIITKFFKWNENRIEWQTKEAILKRKKEIDKRFFHKLFRLKPATDEDAVSELSEKNSIFYSDLNQIQFAYSEEILTAKELLLACKAVHVVHVSVEELNKIYRHVDDDFAHPYR